MRLRTRRRSLSLSLTRNDRSVVLRLSQQSFSGRRISLLCKAIAMWVVGHSVSTWSGSGYGAALAGCLRHGGWSGGRSTHVLSTVGVPHPRRSVVRAVRAVRKRCSLVLCPADDRHFVRSVLTGGERGRGAFSAIGGEPLGGRCRTRGSAQTGSCSGLVWPVVMFASPVFLGEAPSVLRRALIGGREPYDGHMIRTGLGGTGVRLRAAQG